MGVLPFMDTILVPLSLFITIGYHAYLWHNLRHKPFVTTIGINMLKRRSWLQKLNQGDDKKGMLAVQSLRNTLMATILTATITIIITLSMGALINNTFNANHVLMTSRFFGSQTARIIVLKYGSATLFLLASFLCSAMAISFLVDANFLINALGEFSSVSPASTYTPTLLERGFTLAVVGNRLLCITFPLLLWMFGPVAVLLSSAALVFGLYSLDFSATNLIIKSIN